MFNFFYILYDQPVRKAHSNPHTIATMKAARNAAAIIITKVKDVWSQHLCSELIEGQSKVIIGDKHIVIPELLLWDRSQNCCSGIDPRSEALG